MKRFALLLASAAFVTPAMAADVIYEEPMAPAAPVVFEPAFTWTGFYVGGQAGAAFNPDSGPFSIGDSGFVGGNDDGDAGFIGGVHVGYDYQVNNFIFGAVADINYIDAESVAFYDIPGAAPGSIQGSVASSSEIDFVGTARLKAGVALDRFALYATGGLAYASIDSNIAGPSTAIVDGALYNVDYSEDSDDVGYAVGGGVDYLVTQNFSIGVEYLYTDLGSSDFNVDYTQASGPSEFDFSTNSSNDLDFHTVWAKASFRFN
ncbi:outer membrane protein [Aureimonas mangrovi]|uniref:outer membrane protein n=1 Tax=Aureimonas mangrovi TaxID=2758041 RepID=UPI00163DB2A4|nr:outer membrane beta-barrel protein [Aureimonas mangrovi]